MLQFLKPNIKKKITDSEEIARKYRSFSVQSLLGIFFGYMAYYLIRNNFALSTPYLRDSLDLSATQVGFLSSVLLISYGISMGVMSAVADKASPKKFMGVGLLLAAFINIMLGFGTAFWFFVLMVIMLGIFQGMGAGPSYITLAHWIPTKRRGTLSGIWNISHNIGGGIAAPVVALGFVIFGNSHWEIATYQFPAAIAILFSFIILFFVKERPKHEGLPDVDIYYSGEINSTNQASEHKNNSEEYSFWMILTHYIISNKKVWLISFADAFNYMIRYGVLSWMPIYLTKVKSFSHGEMSVAFLIFEWAAIPTTLLAGYISDKIFNGHRMPPAIISLAIILFGIIGYWTSTSVLAVTIYAGIVGGLIYVPIFLISLQAIEVVPSFATGSATGLRGFVSYIFGASIGATAFGFMIDTIGWYGGFYLLMAATIFGIICCIIIQLSLSKENKCPSK